MSFCDDIMKEMGNQSTHFSSKIFFSGYFPAIIRQSEINVFHINNYFGGYFVFCFLKVRKKLERSVFGEATPVEFRGDKLLQHVREMYRNSRSFSSH